MKKTISITTDFGLKDHYHGAMKGSILSVNPDANLVDITHLISPGAISEGAFVLSQAYRYFPRGTVHLAVVDPGVGSERRPILIETEDYFFIGPDNGLLSLATQGERVLRAIHLKEKSYFRKDLSSTFHGRDIFGPIAAHLTLGILPASFGPEITDFVTLAKASPSVKDGVLRGEVIYVDSYGNLITDIRGNDATALGGDVETLIKGVIIKGIKKSYSFAAAEEPALITGSTGLLEIAINSGSASEALGITVGEKVIVRRRG